MHDGIIPKNPMDELEANKKEAEQASQEGRTVEPKEEIKKKDKRPKGHYMSQGIGIGVAIGVGMGAAMDNMGAGIAIGIAIGAGIGTSLKNKHSNEHRPPTEREIEAKKKATLRGIILLVGIIILGLVAFFFVNK